MSRRRAAPWMLMYLCCAGCAKTGDHDQGERPAVAKRLDARGRLWLSPAERRALDLQTAVAKQGTVTTAVLRFGKVIARPQEDALIIAPVTGRLAPPRSALGAHVSRGDILAAMEPLVDTVSKASLRARQRRLRGQLTGALAQVRARRTELERLSTLLRTGLATAAERAQAAARLESEQARAKSLRRARADLGRATSGRIALRAPVAGVVASLQTTVGALVQQGAVVARVVQAGPRWVDLAAAPGDAVGSAYRVEGSAHVVAAKLLARGAVVQPDGTRTDRLEADAKKGRALLPGAIVPVRVLHEHRGVVIASQAVVRRGRQRLVFVEVADGRYGPRAVRLAARTERWALVSAGLKAGERVVTRGAAALLGELGRGGSAPARQSEGAAKAQQR